MKQIKVNVDLFPRNLIYRETLHFHEMVPEDIREIDNAEIWKNANSIRPIEFLTLVVREQKNWKNGKDEITLCLQM